MPPEENRATESMHKKLGEIRQCGFRRMRAKRQIDRQTDGHARHNISNHPWGVRSSWYNTTQNNVRLKLHWFDLLWICCGPVVQLQGGPKTAPFLYALILPHINRFSKLFHRQNQKELCSNTVIKDPITSQVCRYTTVRNVSILKAIVPLVSGVAGLNASYSSKADTLNIRSKNCTMWQLL